MTYRLLLFDLDGTLLDPERRILASTLAITRDLMAAGIRVGLATGRSPRSMAPYAAALRPSGPSILFNGGMVWDHDTGRAAHATTLPHNVTLHALRIAREEGLHVNMYVGQNIFIDRVTDVSRASEVKDDVPHEVVGPLDRFFEAGNGPVIKLLLIEPEGDFATFERRLAPHAAGCTLVHSEPTYLEILPPGVTKGAALDAIASSYGIAPGEVIAFGDGLNDLELLRDAGLGVAMGNANPDLRAVADHVIGPHHQDAIATFLREELVREGDRLHLRR